MEKFKIYCTAEQTKKAFELGAPLVTIDEPLYNHPTCGRDWVKVEVQGKCYSARIPTAEQMIGWLEEQEGIKCIDIYRNCDYWGYGVITNITTYDVTKHFSTRKEATLAAIDAALDYLSKNK